ncbi:hypothetical protein M0638_07110 [Roseomonas sp. NAR14]|uniref:Uncharacterized protein n=1 Tax=Roseomonas acroporae TaxID=2937791 RepID=A0A9X1Y4P1_9PROT|nr:hypothetical protein [Roseomonas acroporae]MCK8784144.1 hypothetical protein [Roseomonas acroporae]
MTRRRTLLAGAPTVLLLPRRAGAARPDAALLAACAELRAWRAALDRIDHAEIPVPDDEADEALERWADTIDALAALPAHTPAGIRAKAEATRTALEVEAVIRPTDTIATVGKRHERLAHSLALDILGRAGA